jgi:hypothetical protein
MKRLETLLLRWFFPDVDARLKDLERHFITKRDQQGLPTETLADVPVADRVKLKKPRGLSWEQRRTWLERTEGGRNLG